jgi:hypothetical protein
MKQLRPLLIGLPLLLAGCSSVGFSWSSLSPFHWFGGSNIQVTDTGVGGINAATPLNHDALDKALDGNYLLRNGMETRNGGIVSFYQGVKNNEVKLTVYGSAAGRVARVDVTDKAIATQWGVSIGTGFSELYSKAFGACSRGTDEDRDTVVCSAAQSPHVSYVFSGIWHGPDELMPSDDALKNWQISKIIWQADTAK